MDADIKVDGDDSFAYGMNGFVKPDKLPAGQYEMAMNVICRGGIAMTRPGSRSILNIPSGNLQGVTLFQPLESHPCLVFAVDGNVYYSPQPFRTYYQISGIKFRNVSKFISWSVCTKSTDRNEKGEIVTLEKPIPVLVMQDGATRAAFWDGNTGRHMNPTQSGLEASAVGMDETPIGLWMCWSNNRLWVANRNKVFASDIGNPLKFTETQYLNEIRGFLLRGDCTGIAEAPDRSGIICFTDNAGEFIQSSIQDRSKWSSTIDLQRTIISGVGCVSHRSIVQQYGLLWWWTSKGLISQDTAMRVYRTSVLTIEDDEMTQCKSDVSYDLSGVCGSTFNNFTFHAIPSGSRLNTVVHVLDQGEQNSEVQNIWPSYWTGWRPVEFARGVIASQERVFCASADYDGVNRIWEFFTPSRTDNGIPITSFLLTRQYLFGDRDWKRFRYAEVELQGLSGPTAVMVAAGGIKGAFQKVMTKDINANDGQIYHDQIYGEGFNDLFGSRPQTRFVRTRDGQETTPENAEGVESGNPGLIDKGFSVLVVWSGVAGVSAVRAFAQNYPDAIQGIDEDDETDEERTITPDGCGARNMFCNSEAFETYYATATSSRPMPIPSEEPITHTSTQSSVISQVDAERKASQTAKWYVMQIIGEIP